MDMRSTIFEQVEDCQKAKFLFVFFLKIEYFLLFFRLIVPTMNTSVHGRNDGCVVISEFIILSSVDGVANFSNVE